MHEGKRGHFYWLKTGHFYWRSTLLDKERVPLSLVHVALATFCFEFIPLDGRKPGSMSFDVAFPNTCNLRNQRPWRIELALKYLKRWGIDVSRTSVSTMAAVGQ